MSLKNPVTLPGIYPGTVWLVAQRLNHCATADPSAGEVSDLNHQWNGSTTFNFWKGKGVTNWEIRLKTVHLLLVAVVTRLQDGISKNLGSTASRRKRLVSSPKPPEWLLVPPGLSNGYWRLFLEGVKWTRREANHSSYSSAEAKNEWIYTSTPPLSFKAWFSFKHADIISHYSLFCKKCAWA
jgi:hypothetical protein